MAITIHRNREFARAFTLSTIPPLPRAVQDLIKKCSVFYISNIYGEGEGGGREE